ncbi:hypothetical protein BGZ83_003818 [Gryganskiella cystojenkinii]|nr:hypothetical protein BGZ83_003818 [Gryganskiella cystojenkinii]
MQNRNRSLGKTDSLPSETNTKKGDKAAIHPAERFDVLERLGFGSSGSSVYKALDKHDGLKTVVIKKIPLSTMAEVIGSTLPGSRNSRPFTGAGLGNRPDYHEIDNDDNNIGMRDKESILDEHVDYFVSWIVDHCCGDDTIGGDGRNRQDIYQEEEEGGEKYSIYESTNSTPPLTPTVMDRAALTAGIGSRRRPFRIESGLSINTASGLDHILSLEFCGAGSVADLIRLSDGPLTEAEIGWMMSQILLGLAYLHSRDHVHGDIKAGTILLTPEGNVKLGGSGSIMNHKEGAGERKRRRRSMTMVEFPASWLAPESSISASSSPTTPTPTGPSSTFAAGGASMTRSLSMSSINEGERAIPEASTETDIWALGVACIELSQGRAPGPDTPLLATFGAHRGKPYFNNGALTQNGSNEKSNQSLSLGWASYGQGLFGGLAKPMNSEEYGPLGMGMSEEMWCFISRCLTPEPEGRPTVTELLKVEKIAIIVQTPERTRLWRATKITAKQY